MNPQLKRWLGLVLIVVSVVGLALTCAGLIGLWAFKPNVAAAVNQTVSLLSSTLQTTGQALNAAGDVLDEAHRGMATLVGTTQSIGLTLRDGQPALNSASDLLKQDLPSSLGSAQTAIDSAVQTAQGIDNLLSSLANIPLIQLDYRPDVPFADSLAGIGDTLNDLPAKLDAIGSQIDTLNGDVGVVANQIDGMTVSLRQIDTALLSAGSVLQDYQRQLSSAAPALQSIARRADIIIMAIDLILTFVLVWIAAVQLIVLGIGLRAWKAA
jgi:hypothetical protein